MSSDGEQAGPSMIADIVAEDREGRPVAVVEVKDRVLSPEEVERIFPRVLAYRRAARAPFAMLVDLDTIRIEADLSEAAPRRCELKTEPILRHYDPNFANRTIYEFYLSSLVAGWLRDVAYRWKHPVPPALEELTGIGLASLLEGGDTRDEVPLGAHAVR